MVTYPGAVLDVKPTRKLSLDPALPLAAGLERALAGVIAHALRCAERAEGSPEASVHSFRKSIRRSRGVVKLLRAHLPRRVRRRLEHELRAAVRGTSFLRDADVLLGVIEAVTAESGAGSPTPLLAHLHGRRAQTHDPQQVAAALREGAATLATLPARFGAALAPLGAGDLVRALRESHRRARRAWRRAACTRDDDAVHALRKRVKELRYQLELLGPPGGELEALPALGALAEELGAVTDRMVLREYLRVHARDIAAGTAPLEQHLDRDIAARVDAALARAAGPLGEKPKAFARRQLGRA